MFSGGVHGYFLISNTITSFVFSGWCALLFLIITITASFCFSDGVASFVFSGWRALLLFCFFRVARAVIFNY